MNNKKIENIEVDVICSTIDISSLIEKVVALYNFDNITNYEFIQRGNNDTYKLQTSSADYILRIYRYSWRDTSEINFEIDVLQHLNKHGVNVSFPIRKIDGNFLTKINAPEGIRYMLITKFANGKELTYSELNDAYIYGKSVANIHLKSENFESNHHKNELDMNFLLYEPIEIINNYLSKYLKEKKYFESFIKKLLTKIKSLPMNDLEFGFCHGDLHGGNAHQYLNNIIFFDFDFCGFGWRSYDIAVFRWGCRLRNQEDDLWAAYLDGYRSVKRISDIDLEWSKYFLIIRDIWVMALHIKNSKSFGTIWISDMYIKKRMKFLRELERDYLS